MPVLPRSSKLDDDPSARVPGLALIFQSWDFGPIIAVSDGAGPQQRVLHELEQRHLGGRAAGVGGDHRDVGGDAERLAHVVERVVHELAVEQVDRDDERHAVRSK